MWLIHQSGEVGVTAHTSVPMAEFTCHKRPLSRVPWIWFQVANISGGQEPGATEDGPTWHTPEKISSQFFLSGPF